MTPPQPTAADRLELARILKIRTPPDDVTMIQEITSIMDVLDHNALVYLHSAAMMQLTMAMGREITPSAAKPGPG